MESAHFNRVREIIMEQLEVEAHQVTEDAKFIEDLGADSLATIELVMALEEEFDIEIPDEDEVKHVLYDLQDHIQIPGIAALRYGRTYEQDGVEPHWRGIYDDKGRLMVAINFNMDLGDAWELANEPYYPEPMTALATRFAVNYVIYAMTH